MSPITKPLFCKDLCLNGGICPKTTCLCSNGWTEDYCGYDNDECQNDNDHCLNDGTCANTVGSYVYVCTQSFMDYKCSTTVDDCLVFSSLCHYGGTCVDTKSGYYCVCRAGYSGSDCSSLREAIFAAPMSQLQGNETKSRAWHVHFDTVENKALDIFNKETSSVMILTNGIYNFYYTIGLGNGSPAYAKLSCLPQIGPVRPLFRNGSIFTNQTSLMTFDDIRQ